MHICGIPICIGIRSITFSLLWRSISLYGSVILIFNFLFSYGSHHYKPELIVIRQRMFMQIEILPNVTKEIEFQILYIYSANTIITLYYTYCMYVCIVFLHTIVVYTFVLSSYLLGCPQSVFHFIRK